MVDMVEVERVAGWRKREVAKWESSRAVTVVGEEIVCGELAGRPVGFGEP
jgi:hypothetical protein